MIEQIPWPAIWSAIAASFSALTAWMAYRINVENFYERVRPELIITG